MAEGRVAILKLATADAAVSFLWVFATSCLGVASMFIAKLFDFNGNRTPIIIGLVFFLILAFSMLANLLGGATWNATGPVAFYAAGFSKDTLFSLAVRLPASALGAAGGALAIMEVMPSDYKHMLGGPSLKVDPHTGAIAEGVLTFIINFIVLWTILRGPKNGLVKILIITLATIFLVGKGGPYTGPAMNPSNAFGWAFVNQKHSSWEHIYVYWVTPLIGTLAAAWLFQLIFARPNPPPKEKAA